MNYCWHWKTRHWATWWWRPHPSVFHHFDTISEFDGRTDRRTEGFAVAYTALAKLCCVL